MSSSRSSTEQHGGTKYGKKKIVSDKVRSLGEKARKRTLADTSLQEGAEAGVKLEKDQPVHPEANMASSPPLPIARTRTQDPRSSSTDPEDEDVEIGYMVKDYKRRKKVADSAPTNTSPTVAAAPKRLGGSLTPRSSTARPDVDRHTACYLQVLRDLELSDETVAGAIAELVKAKLKDVIVLPDHAIASKVPQILEQLRQHGVSASKCEEVTERLQRAEAKQLARRIAGFFSDQDMLEMVSDALCTEVEKATPAESLHHSYTSRSMSAHASSALTASVGLSSSQDFPVPKRAKTAMPDSDSAVLRGSSTPRGS